MLCLASLIQVTLLATEIEYVLETIKGLKKGLALNSIQYCCVRYGL